MASERFPSEAPSAKRACTEAAAAATGIGSAKEPLLPRSSPVRLLTTAYFDLMARSGAMRAHMPPELQEIVFDYLAPSALQLLAEDTKAVLLREGVPTQPFLDALREMFNAYATHEVHGLKVMNAADCARYIAGSIQPSRSQVADSERFIHQFGLPHYIKVEFVAFDGFVKCTMEKPDAARRSDLALFSERLNPI